MRNGMIFRRRLEKSMERCFEHEESRRGRRKETKE